MPYPPFSLAEGKFPPPFYIRAALLHENPVLCNTSKENFKNFWRRIVLMHEGRGKFGKDCRIASEMLFAGSDAREILMRYRRIDQRCLQSGKFCWLAFTGIWLP